MDIFNEFNSKLDKLTKTLTNLASLQLLSSKDILLYNHAISNIITIQNYFSTGIDLDLGLNSKALQTWKDFETNRSVFFAKPYTPISRKSAVKKVLQLVEGSEDDFINVVEWAIALNYKEITPNILNIVERKKEEKEEKGDFFKNSKYANYNNFMYFFRNHSLFLELDIKAYYTKVLTWSESKDKRSKHWGYTALMFLDRDIANKQEIRLTPDNRKKETLTDHSKLNAIWQKAIKGLPTELQEVQPFKLFRLTLYLKANATAKKIITEHFETILLNMPKIVKTLKI